MSSMLVAAAIYKILKGGNNLFSNFSLPICNSKNKNSFFQSINTVTDTSTLNIGKDKFKDYLTKIGGRINQHFPSLLKNQADVFLTGIQELINNEIWNSQNASSLLLSTSYSSDLQKYSLFALKLSDNIERIGVTIFKTSVNLDIGESYQYISLFKKNNDLFQSQEFHTFQNKEDFNKLIDSIEISLLPTALGYNFAGDTFLKIFIEAAIQELDQGIYPFNINLEELPIIRSKLLNLLSTGFGLLSNQAQINLNQKCQ